MRQMSLRMGCVDRARLASPCEEWSSLISTLPATPTSLLWISHLELLFLRTKKSQEELGLRRLESWLWDVKCHLLSSFWDCLRLWVPKQSVPITHGYIPPQT